jgi:hypothetical protein
MLTFEPEYEYSTKKRRRKIKETAIFGIAVAVLKTAGRRRRNITFEIQNGRLCVQNVKWTGLR